MSGAGYFGFTPGATQYGAGASGYPTAGYAVTYAPTPTAPYGFTAATATGYQAYATQAPPPPPPAQAPPFAAFTAGAAPAAAHHPKPPQTNPQFNTPKPPGGGGGGMSTYTGYDAAVYAAATSYLQSKAQGNNSTWLGLKKTGAAAPNTAASSVAAAAAVVSGYGRGSSAPSNYRGNSSYGGGGGGGFPRKTTPYGGGGRGGGGYRSGQQLHYCDVCKISCAGPQTYKEHLEGQKHKKKEQAAKSGSSQPLAKSKASFRCDLCDVTCTGQDTYQAHVRGAKHVKTLKLHQTLGKPIPNTEPVIIPPAGGPGKPMIGTVSTDASGKKVIGVAKMNFVGGQKLTSTGGGSAASDSAKASTPSDAAAAHEAIEAALALEKDVQPVGEDYVEPMKDHTGKVIQFFCKLCDCKFNDLNAKDMHLKGRRHRLQFKKKVNPELEVDMKPVPGGRGNQRRHEEKLRKELMRLRQQELWSMRAMYPTDATLPPSLSPAPLFGRTAGPGPTRGEAMNDRHVMAKHEAIYPTDDELTAVQTIVTNVETALKGVSDALAGATPGAGGDGPAAEGERLLKGVMRVGLLAKGLLLRGDLAVSLVVLCSEKPTKAILRKVMEHLPSQIEACSGAASYDVTLEMEEAGIAVAATTEPRATCRIILTSVLMRADDPQGAAEEPDILDTAKCQEALADLRHAKWFQARCSSLQSCLVVLRVMRDICQRIPTWQPISTWALELLVEKVLTSAGIPLTPGEALRRIFEAVASGILLPNAPGLLDPCEKEVVDAIADLAPQQREDITSSAQHAMRLIAFNQLYKILGIPRLADRVTPGARKRPPPADGSPSPSTGNGKKDKKEDEPKTEPKTEPPATPT